MASVIQRLKILARVALGRDLLMKPDVVCVKERFGTDYGGWDVVGAPLNADSVVYSFGVGEDASFDVALIERFGLVVHAFDPTPKSIEWVKSQRFSDRFVMHEYGIADHDGAISFHPPDNPNHVSHTILERPSTRAKVISVPVKRLSTIMNDLGHQRIDLMKMDVEGAEYSVIDDICASGVRPAQFLVEFHHRFPGVGVGKTRAAIATIKAMGYQLFSVSPSNGEYCFIRRASQQSGS